MIFEFNYNNIILKLRQSEELLFVLKLVFKKPDIFIKYILQTVNQLPNFRFRSIYYLSSLRTSANASFVDLALKSAMQ